MRVWKQVRPQFLLIIMLGLELLEAVLNHLFPVYTQHDSKSNRSLCGGVCGLLEMAKEMTYRDARHNFMIDFGVGG